MESIRFIDVISWTESIFGSSMLSQRRNLKSANISDTEPAWSRAGKGFTELTH